jgi:hypothetical protein
MAGLVRLQHYTQTWPNYYTHKFFHTTPLLLHSLSHDDHKGLTAVEALLHSHFHSSLIIFNSSRMPLHAPSLELLDLITYLQSSNHSTGSKLKNVLNTKSFPSHTTHSSSPSPLISATLSLYSYLALPARLPSSHLSGDPSLLASNSPVVLSSMSSLHCGTIPPPTSMRRPSPKPSNSPSS